MLLAGVCVGLVSPASVMLACGTIRRGILASCLYAGTIWRTDA